MKKKTFWIVFLILCIAATLNHFLYDVTKFAPFKLIAPINESVWEHSKILVFPFLLFSLVYLFIKKPQQKLLYCAGAAKASLAMQLSMIVIYYAYSGFIGRGYLVFDILLTYVCVFIGLLVFFNSLNSVTKYSIVWIVLFGLQLFAIILFTFLQPSLAAFISAI